VADLMCHGIADEILGNAQDSGIGQFVTGEQLF